MRFSMPLATPPLVLCVQGLVVACEPQIPVTGRACLDDNDCDATHYCETDAPLSQGRTGACLPGARPLASLLNQRAFARSALLLVKAGESTEGSFTVIDPDDDPIDFVTQTEEVIAGYAC